MLKEKSNTNLNTFPISENEGNSTPKINVSEDSFFCDEQVNLSKRTLSLSPLEIVKVLLRERALKQVELADKIGLSRQALNNYLRGAWGVPTQIKIKIAQALEVDSSVIWDLK